MTVCDRHATSLFLSNAVYQRIPRSITDLVSSKLSRSDFVQWPFIGKRKDIHLYDELAYAPAGFFRARYAFCVQVFAW